MVNDSLNAITQGACCAHLHVNYCSITDNSGTRGWWECGDCNKRFQPIIEQPTDYVRMRLAQIASGDYKACGLSAEDVARDAIAAMPIVTAQEQIPEKRTLNVKNDNNVTEREQSNSTLNDCRAAFEIKAKYNYDLTPLEPNSEFYQELATEAAWKGWQHLSGVQPSEITAKLDAAYRNACHKLREAIMLMTADGRSKTSILIMEMEDALSQVHNLQDSVPEREYGCRQPIGTAPKGIPVIVAGGIAMQKTGGQWFSGMVEPLFQRQLTWQPTWWMQIPSDNRIEDKRESGNLSPEAAMVIRAAEVMINADIMVTPNMSRQDAVSSGYMGVARALDAYHATQPALQAATLIEDGASS